MVAEEIAPDRTIGVDDLEDESNAEASNPVDAPFGLKKDGTPAKKRGRPKGSGGSYTGTRARAFTRGSLKTAIGGFIVTVNMPIMLVRPNDALDSYEIDALANALDQECQRNARFRKYVEQALAVQGGTSLMLVIAAIAGRRVVRHDLIKVPDPIGNKGADDMLGAVIQMTNGKMDLNAFYMNKQDSTATEV